MSSGGVQPNLNLSIIKETVIPLPPLAEQEQIVSEVERRLSVVSALEATVEANLKRADRLRQSILREAFAGRLVPQDPSDEPVSALLERIRAEREEQTTGTTHRAPRGRRGQRNATPLVTGEVSVADTLPNGALAHIDGAAAQQLALLADAPEDAAHSPRRGRTGR